MEKLIKNTIIETYCLRHCRQGAPTRAVHAEGGAVPINTNVKSEDTEITDSGEITDTRQVQARGGVYSRLTELQWQSTSISKLYAVKVLYGEVVVD